ncbi:MAG: hypothetical protein Q8S84_06190 [bacterium]|nr:hypothetical protein [bacterium]
MTILSLSGIFIFDCKSVFVYTLITGLLTISIILLIYSSSSHHSLLESMKYNITSASLKLEIATLFICSLNFLSDLCIHGVSKNMICVSSSLYIANTFFLVV